MPEIFNWKQKLQSSESSCNNDSSRSGMACTKARWHYPTDFFQYQNILIFLSRIVSPFVRPISAIFSPPPPRKTTSSSQSSQRRMPFSRRAYRAIARSKSPRNCFSDVWYMQLTIDISTIRKYRMLPRVATRKRNMDKFSLSKRSVCPRDNMFSSITWSKLFSCAVDFYFCIRCHN